MPTFGGDDDQRDSAWPGSAEDERVVVRVHCEPAAHICMRDRSAETDGGIHTDSDVSQFTEGGE